ncbi:MAG: phosphatase PAP2 family protein [Myxococcota bacterium]|jgi:membrane-associated phospholipid phosphatase|nr:phosphatase PAP2 family protein [Myxococcota bacterium]
MPYNAVNDVKMRILRSVLTTLCIAMLLGSSAASFATEREELDNSGWVLGLELGISAALLVGVAFLDAPESCRWCATNTFDESIRSALKAEDDAAARLASDILVFGVVSSAALAVSALPPLLDDEGIAALQNVGIVLSSTLAATATVGLIKVLAARERPIEHHHPGKLENAAERYVSFFSGHTSIAFALASSATTVAYLRGEDWALYSGLGLGALALTGASLRIVGDAHWASDVLVGMGVGTLFGVGLPLLLHGRSKSDSRNQLSAQPLFLPTAPQFGVTLSW